MKNKILLITNYWSPWNTAGTFRWLHLSKYIDFDVLTSKRPRKGFHDDTLPKVPKRVRCAHVGSNLPAVLSGLLLSVASCFVRADIYIFTSPPETLLFGAYLNQLLGRKVIVDLRDEIGRKDQRLKPLVRLYKWLYRRITNRIVTMRFFDYTAEVIRHGYTDIEILNTDLRGQFLPGSERLNYVEYLEKLQSGIGIDFSKVDGSGLFTKPGSRSSSSFITFRRLGAEMKDSKKLHPELFEFEPELWAKIAEEMTNYIERIVNDKKN